ncbi:hypothetical protein F4823DRAFT_107965 [Ustulina deusta]|nr:hypothetical protein F4823DRAFT_107965 [Ustulina deusta]
MTCIWFSAMEENTHHVRKLQRYCRDRSTSAESSELCTILLDVMHLCVATRAAAFTSASAGCNSHHTNPCPFLPQYARAPRRTSSPWLPSLPIGLIQPRLRPRANRPGLAFENGRHLSQPRYNTPIAAEELDNNKSTYRHIDSRYPSLDPRSSQRYNFRHGIASFGCRGPGTHYTRLRGSSASSRKSPPYSAALLLDTTLRDARAAPAGSSC